MLILSILLAVSGALRIIPMIRFARQSNFQAELARRLKNGHLTFEIKLEEKKTSKVLAPISQEEFFESLSKEESSFSDMRKELQLELE